jgi:chemotaxis protein methyltransferase CheR
MQLTALLPTSDGWDVQILASDLSTRVLGHAREGVYRIDRAAEIPPEHLKRFMLRGVGTQSGRMAAGPEIRALVQFAQINLLYDVTTTRDRFDAIFCRNVLIYFGAETKRRVVTSLAECLEPHGRLFLGHAESLTGMQSGLRHLAPGIYAPSSPSDDRYAMRRTATGP